MLHSDYHQLPTGDFGILGGFLTQTSLVLLQSSLGSHSFTHFSFFSRSEKYIYCILVSSFCMPIINNFFLSYRGAILHFTNSSIAEGIGRARASLVHRAVLITVKLGFLNVQKISFWREFSAKYKSEALSSS